MLLNSCPSIYTKLLKINQINPKTMDAHYSIKHTND